jgi:hypothetical protein
MADSCVHSKDSSCREVSSQIALPAAKIGPP